MNLSVNAESMVNCMKKLNVNEGKLKYEVCQNSFFDALQSFTNKITETGIFNDPILKQEFAEQVSKIGINRIISKVFEVHVEAVSTDSTIPLKGFVKETEFSKDFIAALQA